MPTKTPFATIPLADDCRTRIPRRNAASDKILLLIIFFNLVGDFLPTVVKYLEKESGFIMELTIYVMLHRDSEAKFGEFDVQLSSVE